jgi:hypothetical protein
MLPAFARLWPRSLRSTHEGRCQPVGSSKRVNRQSLIAKVGVEGSNPFARSKKS